MFPHIRFLLFLPLLMLFSFPGNGWTTPLLWFDGEDGTAGEELPRNASDGGIEFCGPDCGGEGEQGIYASTGGAPHGQLYWQFATTEVGQTNVLNHITIQGTDALPLSLGTTYYLAYFMNFTRINGKDIWHEEIDQSADKGIEIHGEGLRWSTGRGQWDSYSRNRDHHYTVLLGNPTYHLNEDLEHTDVYWQNANGYSETNPIQLSYETWYGIVMAITIANDTSGSVSLWVNGTQVFHYADIQTVASSTPSLDRIDSGGTIAQRFYDAPLHLRKFDALLFTADWNDVIAGGYLTPVSSTASSILSFVPVLLPHAKEKRAGAKSDRQER